MKKPTPDNSAKTGFTCPFCFLVVRGNVEGGAGSPGPPRGATVVVVVVGGTVVVDVPVTAGLRR
jgi:hypothetical protein